MKSIPGGEACALSETPGHMALSWEFSIPFADLSARTAPLGACESLFTYLKTERAIAASRHSLGTHWAARRQRELVKWTMRTASQAQIIRRMDLRG